MSTSSPPSFSSKLADGRERFLATVVNHGLETGLRTSDDFVRNFPPLQIMLALADQPELRADVLEPTVGTRRKIALRKSPQSSGEDLELSLDEGETETATILEHFSADDRVRYLDADALWAYAIEGGYWKLESGDDGWEAARQHITHMLETALTEDLVMPLDIVTGITAEQIMEKLPLEQRAKLLEAALNAGRAGRPFSDAEFLETLPVDVVTQHVPLAHIWATVVSPTLAFGDAPEPVTANKPAAKAAAEADAGVPEAVAKQDSDLFDPESMMEGLDASTEIPIDTDDEYGDDALSSAMVSEKEAGSTPPPLPRD